MRIITAGRTDTDEYFRYSGIRSQKRLKHHPFLVFVCSDEVEVCIVDNIKTLLEYSDDVQVMSQWEGEYKSDFFQFTVGELRNFIAENPPTAMEQV